MKNPPQPSTPSTNANSSSILGISVEETLKLWHKEGAPIIYLGPGETCEDLDSSLSETDIPEYKLKAIKGWLDKYKDTMSRSY